jgi:hypothetical protein
MARKANRRAIRVSDLLYPIYLVPSKGGPGLRLHLRDGRWRVAHLNWMLTSPILRAATCGRADDQCSGRCPTGKSCQRVIKFEIEPIEVPQGVPPPPSGRTGDVITRTRVECVCLPSVVSRRRRVAK